MQPMTFLVFCSGVCIFEQQSSDVTVNSGNEESRRGFTSAVMLPNDQGLLCVTADQQFLFYCPMRTDEEAFQLNLFKRLIGYNDEILDLKFVGEDEQYLAVATNLEQVCYLVFTNNLCTVLVDSHLEFLKLLHSYAGSCL
jgi:U3 small nucleolar RNA-associated protein 13